MTDDHIGSYRALQLCCFENSSSREVKLSAKGGNKSPSPVVSGYSYRNLLTPSHLPSPSLRLRKKRKICCKGTKKMVTGQNKEISAMNNVLPATSDPSFEDNLNGTSDLASDRAEPWYYA